MLKSIIQNIVGILALIVIIALYFILKGGDITELDIDIASLDCEIKIDFKGNQSKALSLIVCDESENIIDTEIINCGEIDTYSFTNGIHGELYSVSVFDIDNENKCVFNENALFLDFKKLPDIPLVVVTTASGNDPTGELIYNGESNATLVNTEYEKSSISVISKGDVSFSDSAKVRCRGNTSGMGEKKSYKIEFNDNVDLVGIGKTRKDWILLNTGYKLNTYVGYYISKYLDSGWPLEMEFVNLYMNGDWKGIYCLSENIGVDTYSSEFVESSGGYLFEENSYWWADEKPTFETERENEYTKYTIKYPKNVEQNQIYDLNSYMQLVEDLVYEQNSDYKNYLDEDTFSTWLIVKELMGNYDAYGSNPYFTIKKMGESECKLKIGPGWDYDCSFPMARIYQRSANRMENIAMIAQLITNESFNENLKTTWVKYNETIEMDIISYLDKLYEEEGEALEESQKLENARWGKNRPCFSLQKENIIKWFHNRIKWLNGNIVGYTLSDFSVYKDKLLKDYSITQTEIGTEFYYWGWACGEMTEQSTTENSPYVIGCIYNDRVIFLDTYTREDVQQALNLNNAMIGFMGTLDNSDYVICIIDIENMYLYME